MTLRTIAGRLRDWLRPAEPERRESTSDGLARLAVIEWIVELFH